jgi:hypothetical protein
VAHCPATGRIGDINFSGSNIPCLVSESHEVHVNRKTKYTVEAISLKPPETENYTEWIGINQGKANRYVKYFIENDSFSSMISGSVDSEVTSGKSRIDFQINGNFLEVKMPLGTTIHVPEHVNKIKSIPKTSFSRLVKHFGELADSLDNSAPLQATSVGTNITSHHSIQVKKRKRVSNQTELISTDIIPQISSTKKRAVLALVFMFDASPFIPPPISKDNSEIILAATKAREMGVETWQINMRIDPYGVELRDYFRIMTDAQTAYRILND